MGLLQFISTSLSKKKLYIYIYIYIYTFKILECRKKNLNLKILHDFNNRKNSNKFV